MNDPKKIQCLSSDDYLFTSKKIFLLFLVIILFISCANSKSVNSNEAPDKLTAKEVAPNVNWKKIDSGTFVFGSPEDTPCNAPIAETEVAVKLTRPFLIADSEITQGQWKALDLANPSKQLGDDFPVTFVNFYETLVWCNKLSKLEGLDTCYDLFSCRNSVGTGCRKGQPGDHQGCWDESINFTCSADIRKYPDVYSCPGYRLPTSPEWEYAAKAGTTSHTYGGEVTPVSLGHCEQDTALDDIAWYCHNSNDELHPAKQKLPNPWGLYDILGNVYEWTDYFYRGQSLGSAAGDSSELLVDPIGPKTGEMKDRRGSFFNETGCFVRPAWPLMADPYTRAYHTGFRPVRTLFE